MNFDKLLNINKLGNSNELFIWAIVIVIVMGFGKSGNTLGVSLFKDDKYEDRKYEDGKHSGKHYKENEYYGKPLGITGFGAGGFNSLLGGNGIFILLIVALLFLCGDKKEECDNSAVDIDQEVEIDS